MSDMATRDKVTTSWWTLRLVLGLTAFLAGLDKFFDQLAPWHDYLNPAISNLVGLDPHRFLYGVGVIEMLVGGAILAGVTRWGGYIGFLWLLGIAINLVSMGRFYDIAVRDIGLAVGMLTMARLTEVLESAGSASKPNETRELRRVA